jgi:hypothetical protein
MAGCFNDIEVLWIVRFDYKSNWQLSPYEHKNIYQFIYCMAGSFSLILNGESICIDSPVVLLFKPLVNHGFIDIHGGLNSVCSPFYSCLSSVIDISNQV